MSPPFAQTAWPAPKDTAPQWVHTTDGKRLRVFAWGGGTRGTVYIYQGRTEYSEKYFDTANRFLDRGYSVVTWDWRGQGLSTRSGMKRRIGHVDDFADFQNDVDAVMRVADQSGFPKRKILLAHSMGGLIGLRSLHRGLDFDRAIFSAPMWAIEFSAFMAVFARLVCWGATLIGKTAYLSPTQSIRNYVIEHGFEGNVLTNNPVEFENICKTINAHPDLELAGPSIHWVNEALLESKRMVRKDAPDYPCLVLLGDAESIVDSATIKKQVDRWKSAKLEMFPKAQHELILETPQISDKVWDAIDDFITP